MAEENVDEKDEVSKGKCAIVVKEIIDNPADMDLDDEDLKNSTLSADNATGGVMCQENVEYEIEDLIDGSIEAEKTINENVTPLINVDMGVHLTRNTRTGNPILKNRVQSRYLRASTGSCHDFCKYGHKKYLDGKSKTPLLRTICESREQMKAQLPEESEKKRSFVRPLSFPGTKADKENATVHRETDPPTRDSREPKLEPVHNRRLSSSLGYPDHLTSNGSIVFKSGKKIRAQPLNSMPSSSQTVKANKVNKDEGCCTKGKKKSMVIVRTSVSSKPVMRKAASMSVTLYSNVKGSSDTKNQITFQETKFTKLDDLPEKTLYMIEPNADKKGTESPRATGKTKKVQCPERGSPVCKSKGCSSRIGSRSPHFTSSSASLVPSKSMLSCIQESSQFGQEEQGRPGSTRSKRSDGSSGSFKSRSINPREKRNTEQKPKAKRVGPNQSGDKDSSIWKLKFKRGAVITLPTTSNSPRRVIFKKGRFLSGNHQDLNAHGGRRKTSDDVTGCKSGEAAKAQLEKVILRHQEAEEKKNDVNLNNVIEETAGKLVQTRKSKVKALVGAFESVMSLRERKHMVATCAS